MTHKQIIIFLSAATPAVFLLTVLILRFLIPVLKSHKVGQKILDIGPRWHKSKEGTPTMGGLGFLFAVLIAAAVFFVIAGIYGAGERYIPLALTLAFAVGNAAIGFVDDYTKLIKKQNEGLTQVQKTVLQLAIAGAYLTVMSYTGHFSTLWPVPFTDHTLQMGWFAYPVTLALIWAVVNGANFTDGIDGLCSGVTAVMGITLAVLSILWQNEGLSLISACIIGATLGFLVYNFHPARVFMGDTGSLFLGGLIIGTCIMENVMIAGVILCLLFLWELASSGMQVLYFKLTHGKRIFKMAPFHHHMEKSGWSENGIVFCFSLVQLLLCILFVASVTVG